ncbi:sodium/proline symporter PutP [Catenovulum sp. SM1970]|uniref:sodium/proline symporter PutP n=1 Tax=Marinifaba aquimaris TaxID=2741323 RepID=UPI0015747659|nr:sodium/proline symporter PutP [Marinifaba aquimaris]NTS77840.1 sodium/proline symporter PutP [Marinifaba aquimaris]
MAFDTPLLFAFVFYLLVTLFIGFLAYKATSNLSGYLLADRQLGPAVTALSVGASDMSGWLLLGLPGAIYLSGLSEIWIGLGLIIGAYLNWRLVAGKLREQSESTNSLTLPSFFAAQFPDSGKVIRVISALIILLFFTFYVSSGLVGGALLFEQVFGLDYFTALIIGTIVIVSYTFFGGFFAVSWTDFFQGCLMLVALLLLPIIALTSLDDIGSKIEALERPELLDLFADFSWLGFASLMAWGLGYFGQPHILARFMAIKDTKALPVARRISMTWMVLSLIGAAAVGIVGAIMFDDKPLDNSETVFMYLAQLLLNPWIAGIIIAAILAAIMSTIDSQLLVSSSVIVEDIVKPLVSEQKTDQAYLWFSRIMVGAVASIAFVLALSPESSVLDLVSYAWAGFGASFGPVILLALYYKKFNQTAMLASMITGAVTVVVWKQLSGGIFDLYELLPAFIFALLVGVFSSKFTQLK